jgi:hypothetical protein
MEKNSQYLYFTDDEVDTTDPPRVMKKPFVKNDHEERRLSDSILNSKNLYDHTKCKCGSVSPMQFRDVKQQNNKRKIADEVEQIVLITSDQIAWFFSSKHLLNILEKKSGADVRGDYKFGSGLRIILVGRVEVVNLAVDLIKHFLMFGTDHMMKMTNV